MWQDCTSYIVKLGGAYGARTASQPGDFIERFRDDQLYTV